MMIAIFFWWIGLSIVVAVAADTRGRSPIAWFIYAIIFSPLLSGLLLLALPNLANSFADGRMYLEGELRELVILRGASGYLALYRFDPVRDIVRLLRIRHQREVGYRD